MSEKNRSRICLWLLRYFFTLSPCHLVTLSSCLLVCLLAGCGDDRPPTGVVRGTVTYRNKPVPNGDIMFIPETGASAKGTIQADGSYTLTTFRDGDGAVLGKHKVVIVAIQDMSNRLPEDRSPLPPPIVPNKYTNIATTDLRAEVNEGENTINFTLTDGRRK